MNINYLMKSLLDPSEHGQRYFEHYISLVEDYIAHGFAGYVFRQSEDPRGQAATIATLALARRYSSTGCRNRWARTTPQGR
ncbi:hypothetical protein [Brevibacterium aurantiacum]|uniref:hypothetical protein n=1 Tax=Brevibacterium aurantiacum TaxID=273384 RepID=UPI001F49D25F|nr:hypothetical protein [Brevibacterium aurantiacum]